MRSESPQASQLELQVLRDLTQRVGSNPLLAQASTGNTSIKLDGVLWIKASGRWMADARENEILIPLDLADVHQCVQLQRRLNGLRWRVRSETIFPPLTLMQARMWTRISLFWAITVW